MSAEPRSDDNEGGDGSGAFRSVGQAFFAAVERFGDGIAMRRRTAGAEAAEWVDIDWDEFGKVVRQVGAALISLGVEKGDKVAILSNSRVEWAIVDMANFAIGAVTVPIYQSNLPDEVEYILDHAEAKVVFAEDREQLGKVLEVRQAVDKLEQAILIDGTVKTVDYVLGWEHVIERGDAALAERPDLVDKARAAVEPEDAATIFYTSGTTGRPKGAMLTHANLLTEMEGLSVALPVDERDETLLFLPLAHIFARVGFLGTLRLGYTVSFAESIERLLDHVAEVRPTFLFSVPRIYEKVYNTVLSGVIRGSRLKKQIFAFAMAVGGAVSRKKQQDKWVPPHLSIPFQAAEMLVFNKLKQRFGGKLRFFISGGAPLSREIAEFFHAAGMLVLEGYGLTENVAAATVNRIDKYRFGSVGVPLPGIEVRIAKDGEVLLKGGNVFAGYFKNEEATAEAIVDGWFHTGDIGEIDAQGFLRITDRKKDLIVTSAGKNIAPQNIENLMKTSPIVSQFMVYGDKRNYLTALVTIDEGEAVAYAEHKDIEFEEYAELCRHPVIYERVQREIEARNKKLASYETIKKFAIVEKDFEVGDELTPSLKVKRKVATKKYQQTLDELYA